MIQFVPSAVSIDSEILSLLEFISRSQGELSAYKRNIQYDVHIESVAAVDAVHFSTKIEGNPLSRDQVTLALQSNKKIHASKRALWEVLNYSRVRRSVREWSLKEKPFSEDWILEHHTELLKGIVKGRLRGFYREAQCAVKDSKTNAILYMAPEWRDVLHLMKGLLSWLRKQLKSKASPLLVAGQFHFEFVTIHPFMDGNGRLARLLTNGILMSKGYDVERYAALEKQHELNRSEYYRALHTLQGNNFYDIPPHQDIRSWIVYWLNCLRQTYDEAKSRVLDPAIDVHALPLRSTDDRLLKAQALFNRHQKLRASDYADLMGMGRTQAVADLNRFVEAGILKRIGGGRSTVYQILKKKERALERK